MDRIEKVKNALNTCGPENMWKTLKFAAGFVTVGNSFFFAVLSEREFSQLGVELIDISDTKEKMLESWESFSKSNGEPVSPVGEMGAGIDGRCVVYKFRMGWQFPMNRVFVDLIGGERTTAAKIGDGFLLVSRDANGHATAGAMSIGNYSQDVIERLMKEAQDDGSA